MLPPDGRVRVSAPEKMTDTKIRMAVISRIPWIKKQQSDFAWQPRQSDREMLNGESHYLWGRRHRLNVVERAGRHEVKVAPGKMYLYVNAGTSNENRALLLSQFYRAALKSRIDELLQLWQEEIGVTGNSWSVKKMKTKWGSCSTDAKRIWLNPELAKKTLSALNTYWCMNWFTCSSAGITSALRRSWINTCRIGESEETC